MHVGLQYVHFVEVMEIDDLVNAYNTSHLIHSASKLSICCDAAVLY
jgi:hypothetical protein